MLSDGKIKAEQDNKKELINEKDLLIHQRNIEFMLTNSNLNDSIDKITALSLEKDEQKKKIKLNEQEMNNLNNKKRLLDLEILEKSKTNKDLEQKNNTLKQTSGRNKVREYK